MFQFPESPFHTLWIHVWISAHYGRWVSPFGHLRINVCLQLPAAFRSLPRPSSASGAKASTLCSLLLDHTTISRHGFILDISLLPYAVFKVRSAAYSLRPPTLPRSSFACSLFNCVITSIDVISTIKSAPRNCRCGIFDAFVACIQL